MERSGRTLIWRKKGCNARKDQTQRLEKRGLGALGDWLTKGVFGVTLERRRAEDIQTMAHQKDGASRAGCRILYQTRSSCRNMIRKARIRIFENDLLICVTLSMQSLVLTGARR
jgi:hypothetical protein